MGGVFFINRAPFPDLERSVLKFLPAIFYFASSIVLFNCLHQSSRRTSWNNRTSALILGFVAVFLHSGYLVSIAIGGSFDFGLSNTLSLVAAIIALLFLVTATFEPIANLGVVIMPIAGVISVIAPLAHFHEPTPLARDPIFYAHLVIALLGFSLIALAVVQTLLLAYQDRQLKHKKLTTVLQVLPPVQVMEKLLYQMLTFGFVFLTLTLLSGLVFSEEIFGKPLAFTHHIVLSILAWLVFAVFLLGHTIFGWRGRAATRWIVTGFILLSLGYIGTKFVMEVILKKSF